MSAAPIKVVHLMLGDKEITPDTPVNLEGKWVGRLSIVVQNVSSKTIVLPLLVEKRSSGG
jgi:hypothetical protein